MKRYSDNIISPSFFTSQNVSNLMDDTRAEALLKSAVYYIDARDASSSGQIVDNLGTAKELLPTTLGSSTSADSNDPKYLDWSGTNYVYYPGSQYNYLSIPSSSALQITGDIDLRAKISLDSWITGAEQDIITKAQYGTNWSYEFYVTPVGTLKLRWSTDGINLIAKESSVVTGLSARAVKWIRAILDVDNGASGYDVKFYMSDDGISWSQLGSTVTTSGSTSIYSSNFQAEIGSSESGGARVIAGKVYRAQIFNGIDGTKVLDVDTSLLKTGAETSFTAITGQTVSVNRSSSGRKTAVVTQPCWLFGSDDYMEVNNRWIDGATPSLYLPGIAGNCASAPDSNALDITGDLDLRVKVALDDWTPAGVDNTLISKWIGINSYSYILQINSAGKLNFSWSTDGLYSASTDVFSSVATGITDGSVKWVRCTLDVDNGSSGRDIKFYLSDDGINWTQLGTTVTQAGTTSIIAGTANLLIGSDSGGSSRNARGRFYRAQVFNGIDGTKVFDADFENKITSLEQTTFTEASSNAATVTINRSGSTYRSAGITKSGYLYPGSSNAFTASTTDFLNPNQIGRAHV